MTAKSIGKMGVNQMLAAIFDGKVIENNGPDRMLKDDESKTRRGVIVRPVTRRLFTAKVMLGQRVHEIEEEHGKLHKTSSVAVESHSFDEVALEVALIGMREKLLHQLLWISIAEEHPQVAVNNNVEIGCGWELLQEGGEWNEDIVFPDKNDIANTFIDRIAKIVSGEEVVTDGDKFELAKDDEKVLGVLTDTCVRTVQSLISDVWIAGNKMIPTKIKDDPAELLGMLLSGKMKRVGMIAAHYTSMIKAANSLFWCGIRDAVLAARVVPRIGIRAGWTVVENMPKLASGDIIIVRMDSPSRVNLQRN